MRYFLWLSLLLFLIPSFLDDSYGQTNLKVEKEFEWSRPGSEVSSPSFSSDGTLLVFVSRVHWPDGDEAEDLPENFFTRLEERKKKEPRFADPIVTMIDHKGAAVCEARYGSNPSVSPDGKLIVFSRQKAPLTGLRSLAEALAGNDIEIFDCSTKQETILAVPETGYFDNPTFLENGRSVVYTVDEAINGSFGGPVGIEKVDLSTREKSFLFGKTTVPATACPLPGQPMTQLQSFLCSQPKENLSSEFPSLLTGIAAEGGRVAVMEAKPIPAAGDMYMASRYELKLISIYPDRKEAFSFGSVEMGNLRNVLLQPDADATVMILSKYWRPFSIEQSKWLPEIGPPNARRTSIYSPDLKYYLAGQPDEYPDHFSVYRVADAKEIFRSPKFQGIYEATWSQDAKHFAVVVVPLGSQGANYREVLTVYKLGD